MDDFQRRNCGDPVFVAIGEHGERLLASARLGRGLGIEGHGRAADPVLAVEDDLVHPDIVDGDRFAGGRVDVV